MLNKLSHHTLLVLLNIQDPNDLFTYINQYSNSKRLRELIKKNVPSDTVRRGAILNKGVFRGALPIDLVWMLVSLGVITSVSILISLGVFALTAMCLLGWYAVSHASEELSKAEENILKQKLCLEVKNEILTIITHKINHELRQELKQWPSLCPNGHHQRVINLTPELKAHLSKTLLKNSNNPQHQLLRRQGSTPSPVKEASYMDPIFTFTVVSTLLGSFFWGSSEILAAVGFVALSGVMTTPVGVAVAGIIAVGIGIYIGYQRYNYEKHIIGIKNNIRDMAHQQEQNLKEYHDDRLLLKKLRSLRSEPTMRAGDDNQPNSSYKELFATKTRVLSRDDTRLDPHSSGNGKAISLTA
jgi:hypothetical protein